MKKELRRNLAGKVWNNTGFGASQYNKKTVAAMHATTVGLTLWERYNGNITPNFL